MKIRSLIAVLVLGVSASAFAGPAYECSNSAADSTESIMIRIANDGQSVDFLNASALVKTVALDLNDKAPKNYTAFSGEGGCVPQPGAAVNCFAITIVHLMVSDKLMSGAMQGEVLYNGERLNCGMLLQAH